MNTSDRQEIRRRGDLESDERRQRVRSTLPGANPAEPDARVDAGGNTRNRGSPHNSNADLETQVVESRSSREPRRRRARSNSAEWNTCLAGFGSATPSKPSLLDGGNSPSKLRRRDDDCRALAAHQPGRQDGFLHLRKLCTVCGRKGPEMRRAARVNGRYSRTIGAC